MKKLVSQFKVKKVKKGYKGPRIISAPKVHPPRDYRTVEAPRQIPPPVSVISIIDQTIVACEKDRVPPYLAPPREQTPRATFVVHPSEAAGCPRALGFSIINARKDPGEHDAQQIRWWHVGHQTHQRIQGYLWEAKIRRICGVTGMWEDIKLSIPRLAVSGELDSILEITDDYRYLIEIKGINRKGFDNLTEPKDEWLCQCYLYMAAVGLRAAIVIVECKDSQRYKEFYVPWNTRVWKEVESNIQTVLRFIKSRTLPPVDTTYCYFCPYKSLCDAKGGDPSYVNWGKARNIKWRGVVL